jgi:tetratricopeptide (TPR) repeat protein
MDDERAANDCALGVIALHRGRYAEARKLFDRALERSRRCGDVHHELAALRSLAQIDTFEGAFSSAHQRLEECFRLACSSRDGLEKAATLIDQAWLQLDQQSGSPPRAVALTLDAEREAVRAGQVYEQFESVRTRAVAHLLLDEHRCAEGEFGEIKERLESEHVGRLQPLYAACFRGLACVAHRGQRMEDAATSYASALRLTEAVELPWASVRALVGLGGAQHHLRRAAESGKAWSSALTLAGQLNPHQKGLVEAAIAHMREDPSAIFPG